jgi:alanyl-tRNA synthetase
MQFSNNQIYYTPLIEYQLKKENAIPAFVVTHYCELEKSKNVVLMVGDSTSKVCGVEKGQRLLVLTQLFYATGGDEYADLVEMFWKDSSGFDVERLIEVASKLV